MTRIGRGTDDRIAADAATGLAGIDLGTQIAVVAGRAVRCVALVAGAGVRVAG
jgi:hypothetical protein